jgi:CheY-like chemotaxis protein
MDESHAFATRIFMHEASPLLEGSGVVQKQDRRAGGRRYSSNPRHRDQLFEELGCRVFDAYNGQQALKLLQAHPDIQVLFADVRMPGMSGTELAAAAQHLRPALRIVLTSGYVTQRDVPSDIPFVPKPWRMQDIAAIAAVVVRSGQGRPEGDEG